MASRTSGIVLGFYRNKETAQQAMNALRRHRFVRSALVEHDQSGALASRDNDVLPREGALMGAALGALALLAYAFAESQWPELPQISFALLAVLPFIGALAGFLFSRVFDFGVRNAFVRRYANWTVRDETLVIVETAPGSMDEALEILRETGSDGPQIFVLRPQRNWKRVSDGAPERGEILSNDQLGARAKKLAATLRAGKSAPKMRAHQTLLARLRDSETTIRAAQQNLATASSLEQNVSISGAWLLDNALVVQGQIKDVRRNLPRVFLRELPVLASGEFAGTPRAYIVAADFIAHTDAQVDRDNITLFLRSFQSVAPLKIAELWALPLMLRLALIEALRHLTIRIDRRQHERERADFWANRLLNAAHRDPDRLMSLLADLAREQRQVSSHFADRLVSQLYDQESALAGVRSWLEGKFEKPLAEIIQLEQRRQAVDQVAVASIITSMRALLDLDWREVFEDTSLVHATLCEDAIYPQMEFASRDRYRHTIEELARDVARQSPNNATKDELEIAREAVALAKSDNEPASVSDGLSSGGLDGKSTPEFGRTFAEPQDLRNHIGYFLADDGLPELAARVGARLPFGARLHRFLFDHSALIYIGGIALVTFAMLLWAASEATEAAIGGIAVLLLILAILPASEFAVQLVDYVLTRLLPPRALAKMSFEDRIPDAWRTLVVVPMMLAGEDELREDIERLEVRALANPQENLRFALLADFLDADAETQPGDDAILAIATTGIEELNRRYGDKFFLFHRPRKWCDGENKWIGWERKRGKLEELNEFLTAANQEAAGSGTQEADGEHPVSRLPLPAAFLRVGDAQNLRDVAFVITLDADTQLPPGTARRLIETLAHPLNRPLLSEDKKRVVRGYGIIQPRVSTALPSAVANRFTRLFTDPRGTDPYTSLVSNVYQDLSGEGAYHGKGIYDLAAFSGVLSERFPDNTLLSHDLLEGAHIRVGLATDIELFDQFPSNYFPYAKRAHRWIRGDWQIASWLKSQVPTANGHEPNVLSALNKWKIFDNLRRSFVPIASLALLVFGWFFAPSAAKIWSALVASYFLLPVAMPLITWLTNRFWKSPFPLADLLSGAGRAIVNIAFLPHSAAQSADAIIRTLYRRLVSHKNLLEWTTASAAQRSSGNAEQHFVGKMYWISALALFFSAFLIWYTNNIYAFRLIDFPPNVAGDAVRMEQELFQTGGAVLREAQKTALLHVAFAFPFLILWLIAPFIVQYLRGGKVRPNSGVLSPADTRYLRHIARETWRYFDDFIGPQTNWLPPDNYQEYLNVELAPRTSPTNIGLWLLSTLAARDFGYLAPDQVIKNSLATLETLDSMEKHRGHLFNWYDIFSTDPLQPRYVSTVDSGNLLASLWTFTQGIRASSHEPILTVLALRGMEDTLAAFCRQTPEIASEADVFISTLRNLCEGAPDELHEIIRRLRAMGEPAYALTQILIEAQGAGSSHDPAVYWADALERQVIAWNQVIDRYLLPVVHLIGDENALNSLGEDALKARRELLQTAPTLAELAHGENAQITIIATARGDESLANWTKEFAELVSQARWLAGEMLAQAEELEQKSESLAANMDMKFLFDPKRKLFHIGYNVNESRLDNSYYDLIASECRLASFTTIARGEIPVEHWLKLRRIYAGRGKSPALMSWSGTMFEYLMPLLLTHAYENSLLLYACRSAVETQQKYARKRGIPWGISEAAFSALDAGQTYQYHAFGVPGLGLKRGMEDDLVVAPYATALALQVDALASLENFKALEKIGMRGAFGFYESIDYARQRVPEGERGVVVRNFMVHHQGMSLVAFDNVLFDGAMQARFHLDPRVQAASPLLYESVPLAPPVLENSDSEGETEKLEPFAAEPSTESFGTPDTPTPRVNLLSNGAYSLTTTNSGGGVSRWRDWDISRWRADTTQDNWGSFLYLRDADDGQTWSATAAPFGHTDARYNASFSPDKTTFRRRDWEIETFTEIIVSPEDDCEIRRVTLINHSRRARSIEVTSYCELALAAHASDRAHPAFSKLFVQTEAVPEKSALLAFRRLRSPKDTPIWAATSVVGGENQGGNFFQFETDRARFIGRGRNLSNPQSLDRDLSGTDGAVLDPVFALRRRVKIDPGERIEISFVTAAGTSKEGVLSVVEKYADLRAVSRAFELAWTHAQLEMHRLRIETQDAQNFQQLAGHMIYPSAALRAPAHRLRQNTLGQPRLWAYGISGDLPTIVVTIGNTRDVRLVRQVLMAHEFWRARGLKTDLIILNEDAASYEQALSTELQNLVNASGAQLDQPGGVFVRASGAIPDDDMTLLLSIARVVLVAARGGLSQQLGAIASAVKLPPRLALGKKPPEEISPPLPFMELPYFNGTGGFSQDGREYVIYLGPETQTPAPWSNVMANEKFGALVTESGTGFCWFGNSQSNRISPWLNDPTSDPAGEAIYIRDEDSGTFWNPTPLPIRENDAYRVRHGQGYSVFEHNSHAVEQEMTTFVPCDENGGATVKVQRLRLKNRSSRRRRLSVFSYSQLVLGTTSEETQQHVVTDWNDAKVLLARNHYHPDFGNRVSFFASSPAPVSHSGDRTEFIGRNGSAKNPAALGRHGLSGRSGAGLDPCAALQVVVDLEIDGETEVIFITGQADNEGEAIRLAREWRSGEKAETALQTTRDYWDEILSTLQISTPDLGVNFLLNRWLMYQDLSCRIWARSAFYQSGGAFGFRDQLQDVMAVVYAAPHLAREQIIRAASHQFIQGDVQHWWHPPSGAGVRTKFSDDLLWLPFVTAHYVRTTGDASVLNEIAPFIEGKVLDENEHEIYMNPTVSGQSATILEHCRRSILKGLTSGAHGLPLMGIGDWNDGMSRVGVAGKGESVWLAWFIIHVLRDFSELLGANDAIANADEIVWCKEQAIKLAATIEEQAWDGEYYIRAYFDDGSKLGSHTSDEAKIDSLPQSWSILSGAGNPQRAELGMLAVEKHLIRERDKMILLFTPPFDKSSQDPGYIKGYVPGVRENGGQYTHAAIWVAQAFARKGDGARAVELLRMLNPVEHARDESGVARYQVEPYVITADIYALKDRVGRGGWSWYTGSSSWYYRVWIEDVLGFHKRGDTLFIEPSLPPDWNEITVRYRFGTSVYQIAIAHGEAKQTEIDGEVLADGQGIELRDDGQTHDVRVTIV